MKWFFEEKALLLYVKNLNSTPLFILDSLYPYYGKGTGKRSLRIDYFAHSPFGNLINSLLVFSGLNYYRATDSIKPNPLSIINSYV